jgi:hypothetical protein
LAVNAKDWVAGKGYENNPHSTLTIRRADRTTDIGRADFNAVDMALANNPVMAYKTLAADDGTAFSEPLTPYDATYPYNHVYESEGGHIREMDDTPGKERIHERHSSGTGYEVHPDGTKVTRVKKDNYELITGDNYAHIKGDQSTTTDGGVRVFVNANASTNDSHYTIEVGNNANVNIQVNKGDVNVVTTEGDINLKSGKDLNIDALQTIRFRAAKLDAEINGPWTENVTGVNRKTGSEIDMDADPINLN